MDNYVNQVHHITNMRESREVKIKINFAWFTFVYAGNMLLCVMNIIYFQIITHLHHYGSDKHNIRFC